MLLSPLAGRRVHVAVGATASVRARFQPTPETYEEATRQWRSVNDIHGWIKDTFFYDFDRQGELEDGGAPPYAPKALYESARTSPDGKAHGGCVDLAVFGVDAANKVDPAGTTQLMQVNMTRVNEDGTRKNWRHWIAVYEKDGQFFGFADSRKPSAFYDGLDGRGYGSAQALFDAYKSYWNRVPNRRGDIVDNVWPGKLNTPRR